MHVLLVHGLGRTAMSVTGLARFLRKAGYTTEAFGYIGAFESFSRIQQRLRWRLEGIADKGVPYYVLGHSLGGLLLRAALPGLKRQPDHFVMLGTPNRPPRLAQRFGALWPFRLAAGDPGQRLRDPQFFADLPLPTAPYTIIAGTAGLRGHVGPFGTDKNDGLVAVAETLVTDTDQPVLLPVGHTFMMHNASVKAAVLRALTSAAA